MEKISPDKKYIYGISNRVCNSEKLCRIDLTTKKITQCVEVKAQCAILQIEKRIFITGGFEGIPSEETYEFNDATNSLVSKTNMKNGKFNHSMIAIDSNKLWTVGGADREGINTFCEEYDINENIWKELPNLNNKRYWTALAIMNPFVYSIGGGCSENTIERINYNLKDGWNMVTINSKQINFDDSPAAFKITESEIIIFAGGYSKDAGIYDTKNGTITKCQFSVKDDYFYYNAARILNETVYIWGGFDGHLHMFDIKEKNYHFLVFDQLQ